MAKPVTKSTAYENAVSQLNTLQSNARTIQQVRKNREFFQSINLAETMIFLKRCNIELDDIDKLNVIHISGTKGKGSTCAFIESILRQFGYKTGFYSSPHLVHVRERIRINGRPLSETAFTKYFFTVYDRLQKGLMNFKAVDDGAMPTYFKFLTLMAFHVFIEEKVDVAIIEVGIGGEHDCTNVIRNPVVCGVTTLDFDHVSLLGSTLEEIAWQKAGIFKKGSVAVVADQTPQTMNVMMSRAIERKCQLRRAPKFDAYNWPCEQLEIGIPGQHQYWNITLAMQLAKLWLQTMNHKCDALLDNGSKLAYVQQGSTLPGFVVPEQFIDGIRLCKWPGRSQMLRISDSLIYFLDGAHTPKSLECCATWYKWDRQRVNQDPFAKPLRILLFHCTGDRKPESLLPHLVDCNFDIALFCPTRLRSTLDISSDHSNFNQDQKEQYLRSEENMIMWKKLNDESAHAEHFDCIEKAIRRIDSLHNEKQRNIEVLVTGSLHLVGGVLSFIEPHS
ncbi:unnamed protein product [Anisakis simplex]|uniref:Folylpolyglutamate synthase n=1 Tax=Anisakis simplex TaxID=6269 RepID=A0A0M3JXR3_ANISI|nr:unnamed protein product [Anisakis simplex]